jgi:hypothetical protein
MPSASFSGSSLNLAAYRAIAQGARPSVTNAAGVFLALPDVDVGLMAYGLRKRQSKIEIIRVVRQDPYCRQFGDCLLLTDVGKPRKRPA